MLRHSPLSAAATAGSNSSRSSNSKARNVGSAVKPVQHHLDRASQHFEGFIVDLMDRITNVRNDTDSLCFLFSPKCAAEQDFLVFTVQYLTNCSVLNDIVVFKTEISSCETGHGHQIVILE